MTAKEMEDIDRGLADLRAKIASAREVSINFERGVIQRPDATGANWEYVPTDGYTVKIRINGGAKHVTVNP